MDSRLLATYILPYGAARLEGRITCWRTTPQTTHSGGSSVSTQAHSKILVGSADDWLGQDVA